MEMKRKGFTLLEILVVVVILGILAGVATAWVGTTVADAKEATRQSDLITLERQLELYRVQHGDTYPWEWEDIGEDIDLVIEQLLQRTNEYGEVMPADGNPRQYKYGPYLDKFPMSAFAQGDKSDGVITFGDVFTFEPEDSSNGYSSSDGGSSTSSPSASSGRRGRVRR